MIRAQLSDLRRSRGRLKRYRNTALTKLHRLIHGKREAQKGR